MAPPIRRIVTGHDAAGKSVILMDGAAPGVFKPGPSAPTVTELWETRGTPADNAGAAEVTDHPFRLYPPPGGSVFRIIEYLPDRQRGLGDRAADFRAMGAAEAHDRGARHPGFHRTRTIDYVIVLSGEIYAMMDEGETLMKAGDVLIQRGTNHAWSNRSDQPAYLAFVLIDANPV